MIIRCPNCRTGYNVPEDKLPESGRTVRCTQCDHTWLAKRNENTPAGQPPLPPKMHDADKSVSEVLAKEKSVKKKQGTRIALAALAAIFMIGALFGLSQNMLFQAGSPSSSARYQDTLEIDGLEIPETSIERTLTEGRPATLTFTGKVINKTGATLRVPKILVSLHDEAGIEIDRWPAYMSRPSLGPNEETDWVCRFFDPELDKVSEHRIRFVQ